MKTIELSQGKVAMVDDEDFEELNQHRWCAAKLGNTFYATRHTKGVKPRRTIQMHREIMNTPNGLQTDHINGNGLDNTKSNLRIVTTRQNGQNRHENKGSSYPGVCWHKATGKWLAQISINGKVKHLGLFRIESEAHKAYLKSLKEIGEIYVNEIKEEII